MASHPHEDYLLAIPYTISPNDDTPRGQLKREASDDYRTTADSLGVTPYGRLDVTIEPGSPSRILVLGHVKVTSTTPKHVTARAAYLKRGRAARTLDDLAARSAR